MDELLREASKLCLDLWQAGGPKTGGEQYPNMLNVIDLHQRIEKHLRERPEPTLGEILADAVALPHSPVQRLAAANPDVRTDMILDALFGDRGGTVTGRMSMPYHPALRQQVPSGRKQGIGVDEKDYANGGLP